MNPWISDIFEDTKGFIWISTQDGVLRYDGYEFKTLRNSPSNSNSISANWVLNTIQDKEGNYWFGTYGEGLNKLELKTDTIKRFSKNTSISNFDGSIVNKIFIDQQNTLWVLSETGIALKKANQDTFIKIKDTNEWSLISETENGKIWIIHANNLYIYDKETQKKRFVFQLPEDVHHLRSLGNHLFFNSNDRGYVFFQGSIINNIKLPSHIGVLSNFKQDYGYFASNKTVFKYTRSTNSLEKIYQFQGNIAIQSLFIDSKDLLWIGTDKGLYKENKLATKFKQNAIPYNARRIVYRNNTLFLGGNSGLHIINKNGHQSLLSDEDIISLHVDNTNTIWAGDIKGTLYKIDDSFSIVSNKISYQGQKNTSYLYAIIEDEKERLWLGTWDGIYVMNKKREVLHHFKLPIDDFRIIKMHRDLKDRLWIIGPTDGLFKIEKVSNFIPESQVLSIKNYQRDPALQNTLNSNVITDIHEDKNGKIWLGTDSGPNIYNEKTDNFESLIYKQELFDEKIMSIEHDSENRIWLGTITKGLFVYDQEKKSFTHYNKKDGLISNAFLFTSSNTDNNGDLYFGTDNGIQIVKSQLFQNSIDITKPIITDFSIGELKRKNISSFTSTYKNIIKVQPPYTNFSISFSSLNFTNHTKINYAFLLEGISDTWQYTKNNLNTAYFTNIHKGTYTFKVKAYDSSQGIETGKETSITIIVIPQWYRSNLAYTLYTLIGIGIFILIYYLQLQRKVAQFKITQLKQEEESKLQRLIDNFHYLGLTSVFSIDDLDTIKTNQSEIYGILSYFATSLFDKNKTEDVLRDITENCISKLHLEDCVIYWLDKTKNVLVQKAAHGNKSSETDNDSVMNPIKIPLGKGIVGTVAQTGKAEIIPDISLEKRYIVDDKQRQSELTVPIFLNGEIVGVIDSVSSRKNFFNKGHLEIFKLLAILLEKKLTQIEERKAQTITNDNIYFKELKQVMKKQKLYRDPTISLVSIANQLNISSGYLSKLINTITQSNFNDFINSFRVEEVKTKT